MNTIKGTEFKVENTEADPLLWCRALVDTSTFNIEDNSVEVVFASDTPCMVFDPDGNPFNQVLSFNPAHIRMGRLDNGAPVLNNHKRDDVTKDQIGVVVKAWIVGNEGRALIRFSKRPDLIPFVNDVKDGIIKGISAGFRVFAYRNITTDMDRYPTLLAIDWEPFEISPTPVQEDMKCHIRSMSSISTTINKDNINSKTMQETEAEKATRLAAEELARTTFVTEERTRSMGIIEVARSAGLEPSFAETHIKDGTPLETFRALATNETVKKNKPETAAEKTTREEAEKLGRTTFVNEERTRSLAIMEDVSVAGLEIAFAEKHIKEGTPLETFRSLVIGEVAKKQKDMINPNGGYVVPGRDRTAEGRMLGFEEAITVRAFGAAELGKEGPKTEYGKKAASGRRMTLVDHGAASLQLIGVDASNFNENEVFSRAMATGDFPIALANVMNKTLRGRYEQASPQWQKFAKKVQAKDFKPLFSVQVDGNTVPGKLTEKGEYPNVTFKEAGDNFKIDTFGLTTAITRQMFINDDLGAFERFAPLFSDGMIYNQTQLVYAALLGTDGLGRVLGEDNTKLFNAAKHNNFTATGQPNAGPPSIAAFTAAVTAMRRQKTLSGRIMNANRPEYLLIPPELESLAYTLINATIVPQTVANVNPFKGMFQILVEDFLTDTNAWLLIGDPGRIESVKYATLDGQEGIFTEQWWNPKNDCWEVKARNDFSATIEEFRGVYKNAGV